MSAAGSLIGPKNDELAESVYKPASFHLFGSVFVFATCAENETNFNFGKAWKKHLVRNSRRVILVLCETDHNPNARNILEGTIVHNILTVAVTNLSAQSCLFMQPDMLYAGTVANFNLLCKIFFKQLTSNIKPNVA